MGGLSIWHWAIVLLVVILIFGTKKLRNIGQDLGGAVKGFKEGMILGRQPHTRRILGPRRRRDRRSRRRRSPAVRSRAKCARSRRRKFDRPSRIAGRTLGRDAVSGST